MNLSEAEQEAWLHDDLERSDDECRDVLLECGYGRAEIEAMTRTELMHRIRFWIHAARGRSVQDDLDRMRQLRALELAEVDNRYARKIAALEKLLADVKCSMGSEDFDYRHNSNNK